MDRVLEIGGHAAGFCGRLFVQNGHDVVRVESEQAPAWVSQRAMDACLHPGKRRIASSDPGLLAELAGQADVVIVEAATADAADAWGSEEWGAPVKVVITPFGLTGPKRNWRATPNVLLAMGGYTHIIGDPDRSPLTLPGHYVEFQAGQMAYLAANACRLRGEANVIDIAMLECVMALSQFTTVQWHCANRIRTRHGSDFWWVVPSNLFACADGWCYLNIVPTFWDAFTTFLGRPELAIDARFETNDARMANRDALHGIIGEVLGGLTKLQVRERANEARIPLGVVQTFDEVLDDPHLAARDFWQSVAAGDRELRSPSLAFRFDDEPRPSFALSPVAARAGFRRG